MSLNLDLTNVKDDNPNQKYDPVDEGWYAIEAEEAEVKETKAGTGEYINLKFRIINGPFEGRVLWHNFNIKNKSDMAVQIGMGQLKKFMAASDGVLNPNNLENVSDLIGFPVQAKLKIKRDDTYGDSNVVTSFKSVASKAKDPKQDDIPF